MSRATGFWDRRRAGVAQEAQAEALAQQQQELAAEQAVLDEKTDAEILEELELPDPETLKQGDDFSVFMSTAVPDRIRRKALRTLWRSNPVLANLDDLVDYADDYTDSATVVENMQTAYQVGKGMLKHVEEMARQAEALANPTPKTDPAPEDDDLEEEEVLATIAEEEPQQTPQSENLAQDEAYAHPTPRRMKFRIGDAA